MIICKKQEKLENNPFQVVHQGLHLTLRLELIKIPPFSISPEIYFTNLLNTSSGNGLET